MLQSVVTAPEFLLCAGRCTGNVVKALKVTERGPCSQNVWVTVERICCMTWWVSILYKMVLLGNNENDTIFTNYCMLLTSMTGKI